MHDDLPPGLLNALQRGLPPVARPFDCVGSSLGLSEKSLLEQVERLLDSGLARRLGAVFDSSQLGYTSTLCAADVPDREIVPVADRLQPLDGVTHCYERNAVPNLWFTFTAPAAVFAGELRRLEQRLRPFELLNMPARRRFRVEVVFETSDQGNDMIPRAVPAPPPQSGATGQVSLDPEERALVRRLQDSIPLVPRPFLQIGDEMQRGETWVLEKLREWYRIGVIRRLALVVRHRKLGFTANGMCVWDLEPELIETAGRLLAGTEDVTHCYERQRLDAFPYNLFAMIHATSIAAAEEKRSRVSRAAGLPDGRMLVSTREFKKSSPVFFIEN